MRYVAAALVLALYVVTTSAQAVPAAGQTPRFEVASVRKVDPDGRDAPIMVIDGMRRGSRWVAENATAFSLLRHAFRLDFPSPAQFVGGPTWLDVERFTIGATFQGEPREPELRSMVQSLLTERFRLVTHVERREIPVYRLMLARQDRQPAKGLELLRDIDCDAVRANHGDGKPLDWTNGPPLCMSSSMFGPVSEVQTGGMTLRQFAAMLQEHLGRPTDDATELTGHYRFTLRFTGVPGAGRSLVGLSNDAVNDVEVPSLFDALGEQLGLKLESAKETRNVLVIDSIERPTPD